MASTEKSMPFIKNLASSDRKIREQALSSLRTFLSTRHIATNLTTLDILKLWKGLFYALWMCDRPLPQQALCNDLAALLAVLPQDDADYAVVKCWLRGFWATMAREWTTGIDVLRMEKFLLLVRRVVGESLVWMKTVEKKSTPAAKKGTRGSAAKKRSADGEAKENTPPRWDEERVEVIVSLLADWPLRLDEETKVEHGEEHGDLLPKFVPAGLKLHVLDIWVDEAEKAGLLLDNGDMTQKEKQPLSSSLSGTKVLTRIHTLVEKLRAETRSTAVRIRATDSLADERLPWSQQGEDSEEEEEEEVWRGLD